MKTLLFYLKLWIAFAKNCFIRQLEYKVNLIGRLFTEIVWLMSQLLFFRAIFLQTPQFAGWAEAEIYYFVGSLYILDGAMMFFLYENQQRLGDVVRNGLLDFYLLRPISAFFMASARYVNLTGIFNILAGFAVFLYPLLTGQIQASFSSLGIWALYMLLGFVLLTSLMMSVCSMAFWTTQTRNLTWLFFELYRLGWRPESIYPSWMRRLLLGFFPAAFLVSVPVQLSLGKLDGLWFVYPWIWALGAAWLAQNIWNRGLARYEGALS